MIDPIKRENWQPILEALSKHLNTMPYSREREMARFYLEELKYRFWHYSLGVRCMATDLDFIEYRFIDPSQVKRVAFIEIKSENTVAPNRRTSWQEIIHKQLAIDSKTPLWKVMFRDKPEWEFLVEQKYPSQCVNHYNEDQYKKFMQSLGSP